jgi:hypothetical protein
LLNACTHCTVGMLHRYSRLPQFSAPYWRWFDGGEVQQAAANWRTASFVSLARSSAVATWINLNPNDDAAM